MFGVKNQLRSSSGVTSFDTPRLSGDERSCGAMYSARPRTINCALASGVASSAADPAVTSAVAASDRVIFIFPSFARYEEVHGTPGTILGPLPPAQVDLDQPRSIAAPPRRIRPWCRG